MSPTATTSDVLSGVDLKGKVGLVTGASSGLGAETARALAAAGASVVLGVRDQQAGRQVADSIVQRHPGATVSVRVLDLASFAAIAAFTSSFGEVHDHLDFLVNNAGVMGTPLTRTAEGFEMQFGVNHLGHFVLTDALLPALQASEGARVVNVSSGGHNLSDIVWDDPNYLHRPYDKWEAYGQSKTANVLFGLELDKRLGADGIHGYSVHPGMVDTKLARYLEQGDFKALMERGRSRSEAASAPSPARRVQVRTVEEGAATAVWALAAPLEDLGGSYLEDCALGTPAAWASDQNAARRPWELSDELVARAHP